MIQSIESGLRDRQVAIRLGISDSSLSNFLKLWKERGDAVNKHKTKRSAETCVSTTVVHGHLGSCILHIWTFIPIIFAL